MLSDNSLFICMTPLQMKIAERIIYERKIIGYKIVCLFLAKSEKYDYYFTELEKNSSSSFFYYPKEKAKGILLLKDVYSYKRKLLKSEILVDVKNIYAASIDNRYVQLIASILKNANFFTFDDGLANLNYNGSYYKNETLSKIKSFLWKIIGVNFFAQNFRHKSKIHYSLYKNKKNIVDKVEYISLFADVYQKKSNSEGTVNIFLGQPVNEVNENADNEFLNKALKKLKIDAYFPHPRENYIIDEDIEVILSNLIFEDYIFNLYNTNESIKKINIYTFFSTAMLNLESLDFIDCYVVKDINYFDEDIYQIFQGFNVRVLAYDSMEGTK